MSKFEITVTGDVVGVVTLPKQLPFAASRMLSQAVDRSQKNITRELEQHLIIRGSWMKQRTKYGINATYAKPSRLEASVYTAADWLLEEEGYNGGVKTPDHGGKHLADPDIEHTRHGLRNKIARAEKARRLLSDPKNRAFKIMVKFGGELIYQRLSVDAAGNPKVLKSGRYSTAKRNSQKTKLILKYVLRNRVKVPQQKIFITTAVKTMNPVHLQALFGKEIANAIKTARFSR